MPTTLVQPKLGVWDIVQWSMMPATVGQSESLLWCCVQPGIVQWLPAAHAQKE